MPELRVVVGKLDVADDEIALAGRQPRERRAVSRLEIAAHRPIQRRWPRIGQRRLERLRYAAAGDATVLVANAVPHRFAQIRRQRILPAGLETFEPPERSHQRVVDQIRGVRR